MITAPGFYPDMPPGEYHGDPCPEPSLNQSLIPALLELSPRHAAFEHPRLNPYGSALQSSLTQYLGEAVHRLALGRGREISTIRYPDYRHSSAKRDRDLAIANNRIPVLEADVERARHMAKIIRALIDETLEGAPYETEVVMCWVEQTRYGPIWCRGMIDVWCAEKAIAMDPKALSGPATPQAFSRACSQFGYDVQNVMYRRGLGQIVPELKGQIRFVNLVVENKAPHGARAFELDEASRADAEADVATAMELFAKCLHERSWPSYPAGITEVSTPAYLKRQRLGA